MNEAANQIAQLKASSNAFATVSVRQAQSGFIVTGQVQYADKATKGIVMSENAETTAATADQAAQAALNYLRVGNFEGSQPIDVNQQSLFANANANDGSTLQRAPAAI